MKKVASPSVLKKLLPRCPNSPGLFQGSMFDQGQNLLIGHSFNLTCKSWDCPYCNPRRMLLVRSRIFNGPLQSVVDEYVTLHPDKKLYVQKMFTFTYPGTDPTKYKYNRTDFTPVQAYEQMSKFMNNLFTALKRKYGDFDYFKIVERQRDGYPHFHVLFIGENIVPKDIKPYIEKLWLKKYKMGFVWGKAAKKIKSFKHAVRYATKYLTKGEKKKKPGRYNIKKGARLFSASRGALQRMVREKKYTKNCEIFFGKSGPDGFHEIQIPMEPVKPWIRPHLDEKLRYRVAPDETELQRFFSDLRIKGAAMRLKGGGSL